MSCENEEFINSIEHFDVGFQVKKGNYLSFTVHLQTGVSIAFRKRSVLPVLTALGTRAMFAQAHLKSSSYSGSKR